MRRYFTPVPPHTRVASPSPTTVTGAWKLWSLVFTWVLRWLSCSCCRPLSASSNLAFSVASAWPWMPDESVWSFSNLGQVNRGHREMQTELHTKGQQRNTDWATHKGATEKYRLSYTQRGNREIQTELHTKGQQRNTDWATHKGATEKYRLSYTQRGNREIQTELHTKGQQRNTDWATHLGNTHPVHLHIQSPHLTKMHQSVQHKLQQWGDMWVCRHSLPSGLIHSGQPGWWPLHGPYIQYTTPISLPSHRAYRNINEDFCLCKIAHLTHI